MQWPISLLICFATRWPSSGRWLLEAAIVFQLLLHKDLEAESCLLLDINAAMA